VLTEKPFASNATEAQSVQRAAEDADVVVFEGFHYSYHPIFARLLEVITGGTLGSLQHFQVAMVAAGFDERDPALLHMLGLAIAACRRRGKYVGICGQGPSDHPDLAEWLLKQGIESMSLNPDTVVDTWTRLGILVAADG
jgi:PEP-utilizing family enzyme